MEMLNALKKRFETPRVRRALVWVIAGLVAFWVAFRIVMLILTAHQSVFNATRDAAVSGIPVSVVVARDADGVIRTPLAVRDNRAYVSGVAAGLLGRGMKVADGEIISVSSSMDLDSGMYLVRTRGVADGVHYAEYRARGIFIPAQAIVNGTVMVVENGVAAPRGVVVARDDATSALISDGLQDGDVVIVSRVQPGTVVRAIEKK